MAQICALKIAYVCAYYVPDEFLWIAKLQLQKIKQFTPFEYFIYGTDIRLSSVAKQELLKDERLQLQKSFEKFDLVNREHGDALDKGIQRALADGCDLIVTLDVDSFPISDNWAELLTDLYHKDKNVVAVQRSENDDRYLTHPCMIAMTKAFCRKYNFKMYPDRELIDKAPFQHFLKLFKQKVDTGIGLAYVLWENEIKWQKIERTNKHNLHYLMAGIYGEAIFHIGASSRPALFGKDFDGLINKLILLMRNRPIFWRIYEYSANKKIASSNKVKNDIFHKIHQDLNVFLKELS